MFFKGVRKNSSYDYTCMCINSYIYKKIYYSIAHIARLKTTQSPSIKDWISYIDPANEILYNYFKILIYD